MGCGERNDCFMARSLLGPALKAANGFGNLGTSYNPICSYLLQRCSVAGGITVQLDDNGTFRNAHFMSATPLVRLFALWPNPEGQDL